MNKKNSSGKEDKGSSAGSQSNGADNTVLVEGIDYYIDQGGRWVFLESFHLRRGYCCKNKCKHCPYGLAGLHSE